MRNTPLSRFSWALVGSALALGATACGGGHHQHVIRYPVSPVPPIESEAVTLSKSDPFTLWAQGYARADWLLWTRTQNLYQRPTLERHYAPVFARAAEDLGGGTLVLEQSASRGFTAHRIRLFAYKVTQREKSALMFGLWRPDTGRAQQQVRAEGVVWATRSPALGIAFQQCVHAQDPEDASGCLQIADAYRAGTVVQENRQMARHAARRACALGAARGCEDATVDALAIFADDGSGALSFPTVMADLETGCALGSTWSCQAQAWFPGVMPGQMGAYLKATREEHNAYWAAAGGALMRGCTQAAGDIDADAVISHCRALTRRLYVRSIIGGAHRVSDAQVDFENELSDRAVAQVIKEEHARCEAGALAGCERLIAAEPRAVVTAVQGAQSACLETGAPHACALAEFWVQTDFSANPPRPRVDEERTRACALGEARFCPAVTQADARHSSRARRREWVGRCGRGDRNACGDAAYTRRFGLSSIAVMGEGQGAQAWRAEIMKPEVRARIKHAVAEVLAGPVVE